MDWKHDNWDNFSVQPTETTGNGSKTFEWPGWTRVMAERFYENRRQQFWAFQLAGWGGFCVVTFFSLTLWYNTVEASHILQILAQALLGMALSLYADVGVGAAPDDAHPALSADVSDGRCFGCHSRSGRISLSFAGLAEVDQPGLRLADGRNVARMPADVHYEAGMRCTSCHTADDVMGSPPDAVHQRDAVMAACTDCHEPHAEDTHHARLECSACHSQWAPQCLGCHMEYDEEGEQWDHIDRKVTAGRWSDRRWDIRNTLPALGVNANGRIEAFVPGMIMTIAHPSWDEEKFVRVFAPLSPHTTGPSRSCESCHRSSEALGLGRGELELVDGELRFTPAGEPLRDGLPADAWTNIENTLGGRSPVSGQRPFNAAEMKKILSAEIQQDSAPAGGNGSSSSASSSSNTGGTNSASGRRAAPSPRSPTK